ncbi:MULTISPECIES: hypothetical protein [unclassified Streptomyces]|uniref:hypothetical protein n=1 Tax=unclassified Streptomyces TaxID=2593676 RepID=UPI002E27EC4F|nr:hypothetical protein [Streptomyces sp. NBC_00223]
MYGHGTAPPPPPPTSSGTVIGLRVLFAVLPVVTLAVGAWGSMLRVALLRKRTLDWALTVIVGAVGVGGFVLAGSADDESSWQSNLGAGCVLVCMCATPVYFLIMDFLWADTAARRARAVPPVPPMQPNPYASGVMPGQVPGRITGAPGVPGRPPYGYGQQPRPPQAAPPVPSAAPTPPAGPRIHQVRAELDELSDFLRKEEGR